MVKDVFVLFVLYLVFFIGVFLIILDIDILDGIFFFLLIFLIVGLIFLICFLVGRGRFFIFKLLIDCFCKGMIYSVCFGFCFMKVFLIFIFIFWIDCRFFFIVVFKVLVLVVFCVGKIIWNFIFWGFLFWMIFMVLVCFFVGDFFNFVILCFLVISWWLVVSILDVFCFGNFNLNFMGL